LRRASDDVGPAVDAARLAVVLAAGCVVVVVVGVDTAGFAAPPNRPPEAGAVEVVAPGVVDVTPLVVAVAAAGVLPEEAAVPPPNRPPEGLAAVAVVAAGVAPNKDPVDAGVVVAAGVVPAGLAPNNELAAAGALVVAGAVEVGVDEFPNKDGVVLAPAPAAAVVVGVAAPNRDGFAAPASAGLGCPNKDEAGAGVVVDAEASAVVVAAAAGFAPKRDVAELAAPSAGFAAPPKSPPAGFGVWLALLAPKSEVGAGVAAAVDGAAEVAGCEPAPIPENKLVPEAAGAAPNRLDAGLAASVGGAPAGVVETPRPNSGLAGVARLAGAVVPAAALPNNPGPELPPPPPPKRPPDCVVPVAPGVVGLAPVLPNNPPDELPEPAAGVVLLGAAGVAPVFVFPKSPPDAAGFAAPPPNKPPLGAAGVCALPPKRPPAELLGVVVAPKRGFCSAGFADPNRLPPAVLGVAPIDALPLAAGVPKEKPPPEAAGLVPNKLVPDAAGVAPPPPKRPPPAGALLVVLLLA